MMEEGGDPSPDPFALDQPLLAFEALMDGIVDADSGAMLQPGLVEAGDEEVEQASAVSAGPASSGSSSSTLGPGAGAGAGGVETAREEKKSGDNAAAATGHHKSAAGQAMAACSSGAAASGAVVVWQCAACTMENQGLPSDAACCAFCAAPRPQQPPNTAPAAAGSTPQPQQGQGQEPEQEQGEPPQPVPKKRKINAADLAVQTLALAAEIQRGRAEVGLVREAEYDDVHMVYMDKLHPDPEYGEDEDLCT